LGKNRAKRKKEETLKDLTREYVPLVGAIEEDPKTSQTVKKILREHRALVEAGDSPMSEASDRFRPRMTREDCVNLLRGIAEMYPWKIITRNFFRNNSGISESTWNRYYGTFEEFKRQAKLKLSRQAHNLERQIAKHASVDHYRALNDERAGYDGKYSKDHTGRFQTMLVGFDFHDIEVDPFALRVWHEAVKRAQPDKIVFGGDIFDLPEFGFYAVDPREWDAVGRIEFAHKKILGPTRVQAPDAEITMIEGNHENRLMRMMADGSKALRVILSDLHGMTVGSLLKLDDLEINYVAKADLAAWTKGSIKKELKRNFATFYDTILVHHFKEGMSKGMPGCHGHSHKHLCWAKESPAFGSYEWHQFGGMHIRDACYTDGEKWSVGFGLIHVDTKTKFTNFEYIPVTDQAVLGGVRYVRQANEE
jgi:hypothetical protein